MSSLMTNIRKISLTEGSSAIGRLLLQLGQAADSTLDAETLAELDKQAAVAACQALDAADGNGDEDGGDEGDKAPAAEGNPEEEAPAPGGDGDADADAGSTKEEGGVHEEDSTATTVELSADASGHGDFGSNNSSSHHQPQPGADPSSTGTAIASTSLMHASSSIHSTTSSHNAAAASPSITSSPRFHGAPSPLPRSARSSREASLVFPGGILSAPTAPATPAKETEPAPFSEAPAEQTNASAAASASEGPVKVVLQGFDSEPDDKVVVCESKALAHLFTRIRNRETPPPAFRFYASRMMRILAEEVSWRLGRLVFPGVGVHSVFFSSSENGFYHWISGIVQQYPFCLCG